MPSNKKRHEFKLNHSFRKWRETQLILAGLKQQDINILMGHASDGVVDNYYRPWIDGEKKIDNYLINEFLKAEEFLTINEEVRSIREMKVLENNYKQSTDLIQAKIVEREEQIQQLINRDKIKEEVIADMSDKLVIITKRLQELEIKNSI